MAYDSCLQKQIEIKKLFASCLTDEEKYEKLISLGREQPFFDDSYKTSDNLVKGCQSQMFLRTYYDKGLVYFEGTSDALISSGLGQILIRVYSGETPEAILKCPPAFLDELGLQASLSPSRANGLYSIHLRMKQEALKLLMMHPTL